MKLLAVGDLHLGRRPSRLPPALQPEARALGPSGAWERIVTHAIREKVDAVALAGDLVEREDDFFEAYRELRDGVGRLTGEGIRVAAVAGNHDVQVLPRLAAHIPEFELLGADGGWQRIELECGGERLQLWGRSFTTANTREDPVAGHTFERGPGPNLGLLHCDLDQPDSQYAPVSRAALEATGLDGWLLGHIHVPSVLAPPHPFGYLGSVTGMDPGERGARGPWLIEIANGRVHGATQWVLAPLRWENFSVDLSGISDPAEARERLLQAILGFEAEWESSRQVPDAVGLRVEFTGRTRHGEAARAVFSSEEMEQLHTGRGGTRFFIERLENATQPEIPLEELAARDDPAGLLARRLLALGRPSDDAERRELLRGARSVFQRRRLEPHWASQAGAAPDDEHTADLLRRAGMAALERLLRQNEEAG